MNPEGKAPPIPDLMRWVFWFALISAIGLYFFFLQISDISPKPSAEGDGMLKKVLLFVGLVLMVVSLGVKHFVRHRMRPAGEAGITPNLFAAYIMALALGEAPAIFGLVLGFQGEPMKDYLPLFVMALVTLVLIAPPFFFPKEEA
ncbi:MAG: hypothetical protein P1U85_18170 [Verrucomicrobiales bacterium]|jgi:F0F1-type ATP synthase membrane subunit c/vacuolar-type H+-ATPase subunit K|nr:hypothetical protein [Verrucomicrobiales bacterium]